MWKHRNLSIIGKICIVNTLITSLSAYRLVVLPTPEENFFKKYRQIVLEFMWNQKPAKIGYHKLIQDYESEGLRLIDLHTKAITIKITI